MIDLFWFVPKYYKVACAVDFALDQDLPGLAVSGDVENHKLDNLCNDVVVGRDIVEGSCCAYLNMLAHQNGLFDVEFLPEDHLIDPSIWWLI